MSLVPVPWQPDLFIHADMLARLQTVRADMGRDPFLYGENSAWRSYAQQKALWDAYQNGTGNIASDPDTGNRTHMRGVAADLRDTSLAMQRALQRAGLQRDPNEAWHWQLPNWNQYPIISKLPTLTTGGKKVTLYYYTATDKPSSREDPQPIEMYALAGESPGTSANWLESKSAGVVYGWAAVHGSAIFLTKASYASFKSRYLEALNVAGSGNPATPQQIAVAVEAQLADDFAAVRADVNKPRTIQ